MFVIAGIVFGARDYLSKERGTIQIIFQKIYRKCWEQEIPDTLRKEWLDQHFPKNLQEM